MQSKPRFHFLPLFVFIYFVFQASLSAFAAEENILRLANWLEWMPQELIQEFEKKNHCHIEYTEYEESEEMIRRITFSPGAWDLLISDADTLDNLFKAHLLSILDFKRLPNAGPMEERFFLKDPKSQKKYTVPYLIGSTGIIYRQDLYPTAISSWKDLFFPHAAAKGKILLLKDRREVFGAALKYKGFSVNSESDAEIDAALELLLTLKPHLLGISSDLTYIRKSLLKGTALMALMYSGDALSWIENHPKKLNYITPKEGVASWGDSFAILKAASNPDLAYRFINYILTPQIGARLSNAMHAAVPSAAVPPFLPPQILSNTAIYPPKEVQQKMEPILFVRNQRKYNQVWRRFTQ